MLTVWMILPERHKRPPVYMLNSFEELQICVHILRIEIAHAGISNPSSCITGAYLSYTVNTMTADGVATQRARASAAMILT